MPTATSSAIPSAVLSLDFGLLEQVVRRHLLPAGSPVQLAPANPTGLRRYQAELTNCRLQPAPHNQCAIIFEFSSIKITGPERQSASAKQAELTCLLALRTTPSPSGADSIGFDYHLIASGTLRPMNSGQNEPFDQQPELRQATVAALLPELRALLYTRLRVELGRLTDYVRPEDDPASIWGAGIGAVRVESNPSPRLSFYYQPAAHDYSVALLPPPLPPPAPTPTHNSALLIGNEHMLRQLVLPSLRHLFEDSRRYAPSGEATADLQDTRLLVSLTPLPNGGLRATNQLPLRPIQTGYPTKNPPVHHYVNPGDLQVELDGETRVTITYTLLPADVESKVAIKIRQSYTFKSLLKTESTWFDCELGDVKLDIWGITTSSKSIADDVKFIENTVYRHIVQQVGNNLLAAGLRYLTGFRRRPLLGAVAAGSAPAPSTANHPPARLSEMQPVAGTIEVELPFYETTDWRPFATTTSPGPLPALSEQSTPELGTDTPLRLITPPGHSYTVEVSKEPALAELNRLLVAWQTENNLLTHFSLTTLKSMVLGFVLGTVHEIATVYDYTMGFVSHFFGFTTELRLTWLHLLGIETTVDAFLARQFYGRDYIEQLTRLGATRDMLSTWLDVAFLPLTTTKSSNFVAARQVADGLLVQLLVDVALIDVPPAPAGLVRPPDEDRPTKTAARVALDQQQALLQQEKRFQLDLATANLELNEIFGT